MTNIYIAVAVFIGIFFSKFHLAFAILVERAASMCRFHGLVVFGVWDNWHRFLNKAHSKGSLGLALEEAQSQYAMPL